MDDAVALRRAADRVLILIPARNEAGSLPHVLNALPAGLHEAIMLDGHSSDDMTEVALRIRPYVKIVQQTLRGISNALACGFAELPGDVAVIPCADESADPGEINARVDRAGPRITEVGGREQPRSNGPSNLKAVPGRIRVPAHHSGRV